MTGSVTVGSGASLVGYQTLLDVVLRSTSLLNGLTASPMFAHQADKVEWLVRLAFFAYSGSLKGCSSAPLLLPLGKLSNASTLIQ